MFLCLYVLILYVYDMFHILLSCDSPRDLWNVCMYVCLNHVPAFKTYRRQVCVYFCSKRSVLILLIPCILIKLFIYEIN